MAQFPKISNEFIIYRLANLNFITDTEKNSKLKELSKINRKKENILNQ